MLDFDESDMRLAKDDDYIMHAADGCATPGTDPATPPRSPLYRPGPSTPTDQGSTTPRFLFGQTPTKEHYFGSYHSSHHHGASAGTPVQDGTPEQFPQGTPDDGGLATPGSVSPMKRRYEADTPRKRVARSRGGFDEWSGANGLTAACADGGGFDAPVALGGSFTNFPREESLNCSFRINGLNRRRDVSTLGALDPDMYGDVGCCDDDDAASFSSSDDGLGGGFASRDLTELGELGRGSYGVVYKVRHAFDDQYFAVKKSLRPFSGLVSKENRLQEVYSLAALPSCLHIVRYHDCWVERNIFYIRFEYCEGGTIASQPYDSWTYPDILSLFFQITTGLRCLHQSDIVHLDVKAENIYITRKNGETVFKLGDFGLVRQIKDDTKHWLGENDDEGDARYLCQAFLRGVCFCVACVFVLQAIFKEGCRGGVVRGGTVKKRHSKKKEVSQNYVNATNTSFTQSGNAKAADVFSLAATVYEIARKEQLPCQGDEWQDVRNSPAADIECAYEPGFVNVC